MGVHLPQISWQDEPHSLERLVSVAVWADRLGFGTLSVNDHLVWGRPWLDGFTERLPIGSLAACLELCSATRRSASGGC